MPVSNPGYFGPQKSNGSIVGQTAGFGSLGARNFLAGQNAGDGSDLDNLIVIGDNALSGAPTSARVDGSIVVGVNAAQAWNAPPGNIRDDEGLIVIGQNALKTAVDVGSTIVIGTNVLQSYTTTSSFPLSRSVFVGDGILSRATGPNQIDSTTMVGYGAINDVGSKNIVSLTMLGANNLSASGNVSGSVILGDSIAQSHTQSMSQNVIIGSGACAVLNNSTGQNVYIGQGTNCVLASDTANVVLGYRATSNGDNQVILGASARFNQQANRGIAIGFSAGSNTNTGADTFVVETFDGAVQKGMLFGNMATGNLIVGKSVTGVDRDFAGSGATNILKVLNGTIGSANPVGGGYFYVAAGALHWVGSGGTDTVLAPA